MHIQIAYDPRMKLPTESMHNSLMPWTASRMLTASHGGKSIPPCIFVG
jgi:hypothetical protein